MVWVKRLLGVILAIALVVAAGEIALRLIIPGVIADEMRGQLGLSQDHPVDVSLRGSTLVHAAQGRIGAVSVTIPDAPLIEGLRADAYLAAESAPFDLTAGDIVGGTAGLTLRPDQLGPALAILTSDIVDSGEVRDGSIRVGRTMDILGQQVPLSATLRLEIVDGGDVLVTPEGLNAAGFDLTAEQIAQLVGPVLEPLLQPRTVCVRDRLPRGIELTNVTLSSTGSATLEATLAPTLMSDPSQFENGSCA
ncbi:MAG: LmeA family phospholipid-binding protein [Leucobacter sp.]